MSTTLLRGALIGLGNIAVRGHVPAYALDGVRSQLKLTSVLDVVEHTREKAAEHLPDAKFYTNLHEMLESQPLDFVDICTPPHTHAEYIRTCMAKGLHIVCEKPLAHRYDVAVELIDEVRRARVVFMPCHQYKFSPLWSTIHELITTGKLGRVTVAQFNVYRMNADAGTAAWNPEWRTNKQQSGGGILVDTGAHYFYLSQYFFGVPRSLAAILRTLKHRDYGVEDTAMVTLEYDQLLVHLNLTWAGSSRANSVYIAGTEGNLSYDGTRLQLTNADGTQEIPMPDVSDKRQYISWYGSLLNSFADRVRAGNIGEDQLCEAINVMKMVDLCYKSDVGGRVMGFA